MQIKQVTGVTSILGTQIFNPCSHILIEGSTTLLATATIEIRHMNNKTGKETKIFPKGLMIILPELAAQRAGYFTDKAYLIEICENANLSMAEGFLIVDIEGVTSGTTHTISTVEDVLGRVKNEPIIYDRLTIPTGIKKQSFGVQEAQLLALPNSSAIVELSLYTKSGSIVRQRFSEMQALQRKENDMIFNDVTTAWNVGSIVNGFKAWLTTYVDHCDRIELETDGTTLELYAIKNAR